MRIGMMYLFYSGKICTQTKHNNYCGSVTLLLSPMASVDIIFDIVQTVHVLTSKLKKYPKASCILELFGFEFPVIEYFILCWVWH